MDGDGKWYSPPAYPPNSGRQIVEYAGGRRPSPWGFWVALSAVALVAGLVAVGVALSGGSSPGLATPNFAGSPTSVSSPPDTRPPGPSQPEMLGALPGASGVIAPDQGTLAFSDQFSDPNSGWTTSELASGTTFAYVGGRYVVTAKGSLHHLAVSPYEVPIAKLSVRVKATQSPGAPPGAGFGVLCAEGGDLQTSLRYEFLALTTGDWVIERRDGNSQPAVLGRGETSATPGDTPMTVEGVCNTLSDGRTTRLLMFVDGHRVADTKDSIGLIDGQGWAGGIDVASQSKAASAVSVSDFEERDLSG
jgi:hypothetical protein